MKCVRSGPAGLSLRTGASRTPAVAEGDVAAKRAAFMKALAVLQKRIALLASLRLESLDRMAAEQQLRRIGKER